MDAAIKLIAEHLLHAEQAKKTAAPLILSVFDSASLANEAADHFIDQVVDESVLLKSIRVHRTNKPSGDLSKINVSGPVTRKATENTAITETRRPSNSVVSYATKKTVSAIDITGEVQEDTVEGGGAQTTIMNAMIKQIANDMEQLSIEGDETISGSTDSDELLKTNDGFDVQTDVADGAANVDAIGLAPSLELLLAMLRALPTKYRRNLAELRWIMSANAALKIQEQLANLGVSNPQVGNLAEKIRTNGGLPNLHGIQPLVVPLMPEDLAIDGTAGDTGSFIWLTNPQNLIYVVQRELTVEWERKPRKDASEGTVHMRTDFIIEDVAGLVRADNVNMDVDAAFFGVS